MTNTNEDVAQEREARLAEHTRLTEALKKKPISQVFIEEAEKEVSSLGIDPKTEGGEMLKTYLLRSYEKSHYSLCEMIEKAPYMKATSRGMAVGCILGTNSQWKIDSKLEPLIKHRKTVSQSFHEAAHSLLKLTRPKLDLNSERARGFTQELVQRFEESFYSEFKSQIQNNGDSNVDLAMDHAIKTIGQNYLDANI